MTTAICLIFKLIFNRISYLLHGRGVMSAHTLLDVPVMKATVDACIQRKYNSLSLY